MTPQEKSVQLIYAFEAFTDRDNELEFSKQCALIAVDEIIKSRPLEPNHADWDDCGATHKYWYDAQKEEALKFWQEVKQEIENL